MQVAIYVLLLSFNIIYITFIFIPLLACELLFMLIAFI
jgi:hypothetical protein